MRYNLQHIRDAFTHRADVYDSHARLQQSVLLQAVRELVPLLDDTTRLLDAGTGTGYVMELLRRLGVWPVLHGCDLSPGMCAFARQRWEHEDRLPELHAVCANVEALPYASNRFDVVLSSLTMQWVNASSAALSEFFRVLHPSGHCLITSFGPSTLQELRTAFEAADSAPHVSEFASLDELQALAEKAGFMVVNARAEFRTQYYPSVREIMDTIRTIGAANKRTDRRRGMTGKGVFRKMEAYYREQYEGEEGIPASWEVLYLMLRKPD